MHIKVSLNTGLIEQVKLFSHNVLESLLPLLKVRVVCLAPAAQLIRDLRTGGCWLEALAQKTKFGGYTGVTLSVCMYL